MKLSQRCISTKNKLSDSGKIQKAIEAIKNKLIRTGGKDIKKKINALCIIQFMYLCVLIDHVHIKFEVPLLFFSLFRIFMCKVAFYSFQ